MHFKSAQPWTCPIMCRPNPTRNEQTLSLGKRSMVFLLHPQTTVLPASDAHWHRDSHFIAQHNLPWVPGWRQSSLDLLHGSGKKGSGIRFLVPKGPGHCYLMSHCSPFSFSVVRKIRLKSAKQRFSNPQSRGKELATLVKHKQKTEDLGLGTTDRLWLSQYLARSAVLPIN